MKVHEILLEMGTRLRPDQTGVNVDIWVSSNEFEGKKLPEGHGRRIKIKNGPGPNDFASIDIDTKEVIGNLDTAVKKQAIAFIRYNYLPLARMWEQGLDRERRHTRDLRKLPPTGW